MLTSFSLHNSACKSFRENWNSQKNNAYCLLPTIPKICEKHNFEFGDCNFIDLASHYCTLSGLSTFKVSPPKRNRRVPLIIHPSTKLWLFANALDLIRWSVLLLPSLTKIFKGVKDVSHKSVVRPRIHPYFVISTLSKMQPSSSFPFHFRLSNRSVVDNGVSLDNTTLFALKHNSSLMEEHRWATRPREWPWLFFCKNNLCA